MALSELKKMRSRYMRDTDILAVRIKKALLSEVKDKVTRKKVTRNSWVIGCIKEGLRLHKKRG